MIPFSLFEWMFPRPEVTPIIIKNAVRSSGIRWIILILYGLYLVVL